MSEKAGGAAPGEGFYYQALVAAYYLVTDDPDVFTHPPEISTDLNDSDLYIKLDDGTEHFFEVKRTGKGEFKWSDLKDEVFPEFYRAYQKHAQGDLRTYYYFVVNTAFAEDIHKIAETGKSLRRGERWFVYKKKYGRTLFRKLVNGIKGNKSKIQNEDSVSPPDDPDDIFPIIYGFRINILSQELIDSKLQDFLREAVPRFPVKAQDQIIEEIRTNWGDRVRRVTLEEKFGTELERKVGATSAFTSSPDELKEDLRRQSDEFTSTNSQTKELVEGREKVRAFSQYLKEETDVEDSVVEGVHASVDEDFEELIELDKEISKTKKGAAEQIDTLRALEDDSSTSNK